MWLASGGLPGIARSLAEDLTASTDEAYPLVHLALTAPSRTEFLDVDTGLIRLLELALPQAPDDGTRAWQLGRLAGRSRDPGVLAEVLDARLHALWDPAGAGTGWPPHRRSSAWPGARATTAGNGRA